MKFKPLVSIIIPFRDKHRLLQDCVESILQKTNYTNYEIILADNRSQEQETARYIQKLAIEEKKITHIRVDMDFNFSAINNYVASCCKGDYLLFLNNDTEVINSSWLSEMVMELQGPKVGAVGAKLLYADNTIQHAGVIYGVGHVAGHVFRHLHDDCPGHMNRAGLVQEYLAVTGACLLTKRYIFEKVAGFDAINLAIAYNDVDLCMKINKFGFKVVYTPHSKFYHYESESRPSDLKDEEIDRYKRECSFMHEKWGKGNEIDPFQHSNSYSHLRVKY